MQFNLLRSAGGSARSHRWRGVFTAVAACAVALGVSIPVTIFAPRASSAAQVAPADSSSSPSGLAEPLNLLTGNQATFSGTTGSWVALNNSKLSFAQTPSNLSSGSLVMTAASPAWDYAESPQVAATPGANYTAEAKLMTTSSASVSDVLAFYNSSGGLIKAVAGQATTPPASVWTALPEASAIAPPATAKVALVVAAWTASVGQPFYIESPILVMNLLTGNQATFSGTTGSWVALNNSKLSFAQTPSNLSSGSLVMTAASPAWDYAESPQVAATPGVTYAGESSLMTTSSASVSDVLAFYNSSGGLIQTVAGQATTPPASGWTALPEASAIAPPATAKVALVVAAWTASVGQPFYIESPVLASLPVGSTVQVHLTTGDHAQLMSSSSLRLAPVTSGSINMDLNQQNQPIDGFGAMLTDSAAHELMQLPPDQFDTVMANLFTSSGAHISVLRIPIGANDFSPAEFTYDDMPPGKTDPTVSDFNLNADPDQADMTSVLRKAQSLNPKLVIIASPWTAPPWMKEPLPGTTPPQDPYTGHNEMLNPIYYGAYAKYLVDFVKAYGALGIHVDYLTVQNEPGNNSTTTSPGMLMTEPQEAAFVTALAPLLTAASPSTKILGYDWNWGDTSDWGSLSSLLGSAGVAGTAWHCYDSNPGAQSSFAHFPSDQTFMTECTGYLSSADLSKNEAKPGTVGVISDDLANFSGNLSWDSLYLISGELNDWADGVTFYNLALNDNCGPQLPPDGATTCTASPPNSSQCRDCRGVVTVTGNPADPVAYGVEYWVLSQASAAFSQGASQVPVTVGSNSWYSPALDAAGALNPDGTIGLCVGNYSASSQTFTVDADGEGFSYTIPANSVASFRWSN